MRVRVHRLLKRMKDEQSERLRAAGVASTSYSALVRAQPEESVVTEVAIDEGVQNDRYDDQPQNGKY